MKHSKECLNGKCPICGKIFEYLHTENSKTNKSDIWAEFHKYDNILGTHRKLRHYIITNGKVNLNYFIAHLSHDIYKTHGIRGHSARQNIRQNLKELAERIFVQTHGNGLVTYGRQLKPHTPITCGKFDCLQEANKRGLLNKAVQEG